MAKPHKLYYVNQPSNFDEVGDFHAKFDLPRVDTKNPPGPREVSDEVTEFRIGFLQEELNEFIRAYHKGDEAQMADALIDLVYVAMGTAHLKGYPWQELWDEVQAANMAKERAAPDGSNSARGSSWDVVKPEGWEPPQVEAILRDHGFSVIDERHYTKEEMETITEHAADPITEELELGFSMHDYGDRA